MSDEFEQYKERPKTQGRRGGTTRELSGHYGAGKSAPGVAPAVVDDESLPVALRGFGHGVTAGTIVYPQAAVSSVVSGRPYKEALSDIRADNARMAEQNPKAWYGGNIAGAVVPAVMTGGMSVPAQLAVHGGLGAVSGYTSSEDAGLKETATGAGLGAGGAGVGQLLKFGARVAGRAFEHIKAKELTGPMAQELSDLATKAAAGDAAAIAELTKRIPPSSITPIGQALAGRGATGDAASIALGAKIGKDLATGGNPGAYLREPGKVALGEGALSNLLWGATKTGAGTVGGYHAGEAFGYGPEGAALGAALGGGLRLPEAAGRVGTLGAQRAWLASGRPGSVAQKTSQAASKAVKAAVDNTPVALRTVGGGVASGQIPADPFAQYQAEPEEDFEQYRVK